MSSLAARPGGGMEWGQSLLPGGLGTPSAWRCGHLLGHFGHHVTGRITGVVLTLE